MEKEKRILLASDHAGLNLKNYLMETLEKKGYDVKDLGTHSLEKCDYPIYAEKGCRALMRGEGDFLILCCGTGVGMSIAANKIDGIRAACCSDIYSVRFTRLHNDANVLCLGERVVGKGIAELLVLEFISTEFEGGRHLERVKMISNIEKNHS